MVARLRLRLRLRAQLRRGRRFLRRELSRCGARGEWTDTTLACHLTWTCPTATWFKRSRALCAALCADYVSAAEVHRLCMRCARLPAPPPLPPPPHATQSSSYRLQRTTARTTSQTNSNTLPLSMFCLQAVGGGHSGERHPPVQGLDSSGLEYRTAGWPAERLRACAQVC